jgi:hypothetical protein
LLLSAPLYRSDCKSNKGWRVISWVTTDKREVFVTERDEKRDEEM